MVNWNPSPKDIEIVCNAITEHFIEEDSYSRDYCIYCGKIYGNVRKWYWDKGIREPHYPDCPVLVAQDIMTGFSEGE